MLMFGVCVCEGVGGMISMQRFSVGMTLLSGSIHCIHLTDDSVHQLLHIIVKELCIYVCVCVFPLLFRILFI